MDSAGRCGRSWSVDLEQLQYNSGTLLALTEEGIEVKDNEDDDKVYRLNRSAIIRGLTILADKEPSMFARIIELENDKGSADALVQCALFGAIIYG